jgi:antirestriction protein
MERPREPERNYPEPRIHVASLSDYNAGRLHGTWLDANTTADELQSGIDEMLTSSREPVAEEWAIHDYEGFGSLRLGEWEPLERVAALAAGIAEHGLAFAAWASLRDSGEALDSEGFVDAYQGDWDSLEDYVDGWLDDAGINLDELDLPAFVRPYLQIDVEALGRDMEANGDVTAVEHPDGVWMFWP